MKFLHLSDLHIGKRVNEFSLLEDQLYILDRILDVVDSENPDAVLIAGDVYDKAVPSAEALQVFDDFLVRLSQRGTRVLVISGNHDSPERIAFGARLLDRSGVYLSPVYRGAVESITLTDGFGPVQFFLLPFLKPAHVRRHFPEEPIESYTDAIRVAIGQMALDPRQRNVLVTHQFVTGASRSDSEEVSVGGSDNVDVSVFDPFDYVALGHIHGPQHVGRDTVRYCGTPLKYSFSEVGHRKSVTVVELGEKGAVTLRTVPLTPLRDLCQIRGRYEELTRKSFYEHTTYRSDYMHVTLTDEEDIPDAIGKLRVIYPNLMKLEYDNQRTRTGAVIDGPGDGQPRTPLEWFEELYDKQNNQPMSEEQRAFAAALIGEIWEGSR